MKTTNSKPGKKAASKVKSATPRATVAAVRASLRTTAAGTPAPFHPFHIAVIAWIFLPHGNVDPTTVATTADIPGLDAQIQALNPAPSDQARVTANINSVLAALHTYCGTASVKTSLQRQLQTFQSLMSSMNNLWDGSDSIFTTDVFAAIASLG